MIRPLGNWNRGIGHFFMQREITGGVTSDFEIQRQGAFKMLGIQNGDLPSNKGYMG